MIRTSSITHFLASLPADFIAGKWFCCYQTSVVDVILTVTQNISYQQNPLSQGIKSGFNGFRNSFKSQYYKGCVLSFLKMGDW